MGMEVDAIEAALKLHRLKEQARKDKILRMKTERNGDLQFNSDNDVDEESGDENPYDSEEKEYRKAAKADIQHEKDLKQGQKGPGNNTDSEYESNSYDSEFEAEFFGKKDPERI